MVELFDYLWLVMVVYQLYLPAQVVNLPVEYNEQFGLKVFGIASRDVGIAFE